MSRILNFYLNGEYYKNNPTWDTADTDWKFQKLQGQLQKLFGNNNTLVYEIGCGSGELLKKFALTWPEHSFRGWDIAPDAAKFWNHEIKNLQFQVGDFLQEAQPQAANIILLIDVVEHLADPGSFLEELKGKSDYIVIHLPLDMTMVNVIFDNRLVRLRDTVGHIHYFTKSLGEKLVHESGYEVLISEYTNAWKDSPRLSVFGKIFRVFRQLLYWISPTLNSKLLGGETLVIVARERK